MILKKSFLDFQLNSSFIKFKKLPPNSKEIFKNVTKDMKEENTELLWSILLGNITHSISFIPTDEDYKEVLKVLDAVKYFLKLSEKSSLPEVVFLKSAFSYFFLINRWYTCYVRMN